MAVEHRIPKCGVTAGGLEGDTHRHLCLWHWILDHVWLTTKSRWSDGQMAFTPYAVSQTSPTDDEPTSVWRGENPRTWPEQTYPCALPIKDLSMRFAFPCCWGVKAVVIWWSMPRSAKKRPSCINMNSPPMSLCNARTERLQGRL